VAEESETNCSTALSEFPFWARSYGWLIGASDVLIPTGLGVVTASLQYALLIQFAGI
jgi:hypothetical protein